MKTILEKDRFYMSNVSKRRKGVANIKSKEIAALDFPGAWQYTFDNNLC